MENHAKISFYPRDIPRSMPKSGVGRGRTEISSFAIEIQGIFLWL
jgi:hypothetical protein